MALENTTQNHSTPVTGLMGERGGKVITNTAAHTGVFNCILCLEDAVISAATLGSEWVGSLAGVSIKAGAVVPIKFTSITLTSGKIIAYTETTDLVPGAT